MKYTLFIFVFFIKAAFIYSQIDSSKIKAVDKLTEEYYSLSYHNPDSALIILDSAEKLAKKINYAMGITAALRERGSFYSDRSDYVRSMQYLIAALKQDEKINNDDGIGMDWIYIGLNYHIQEKDNEASYYLKKAQKKYLSMKDDAGVALVNVNLGMIYRNLNKFDTALYYYMSARDFYIKDHNDKNLSRTENNIGNVFKDQKQYNKALEHFFIARDLKIKTNDMYSLIPNLSNIADVYVEENKFNEAFNYYGQSMKLAVEQKSLSLQKDVYQDLSYAYEKQGDYKKAYENFKLSTKLKDSIISEKYNNEIADMKVKYDSEKKDKENKILIKDNELKGVKIAEEQKQKLLFAAAAGIIFLIGLLLFMQYRNKQKLNKQLAVINEKINNQNITLRTLNKDLIDSEENLIQVNSTKDQLISMLSHDLYNPVTSVINYTNQINELSSVMSKEELSNSFKKVNNAVVPLQDLLDNILQWARIQKNKIEPAIEKTDINKVIAEIVRLYMPNAELKNVSMLYSPIDSVFANTDRLMIFFIVRNVINNAVKFSKSHTKIIIELEAKDNSIIISVKDEGKGFNDKVIYQLNNKNEDVSLVDSDGTGIGLSVSRRFIKLLNGNIEFKNGRKGGAEVIITIPRA